MHARLAVFALVVLCAAPAQAQVLGTEDHPYLIMEDVTQLGELPRVKHERLLAASQTGEVEELRYLIEAEKQPVVVSFGDPEDKIAFLRDASADKQGVEIMARLAELLESPFAAYPTGGGNVMYVWPYHAYLETLNGLPLEQEVDAIRLIGYKEWAELKQIDSWYSWRVGINSAGDWLFFVAGD